MHGDILIQERVFLKTSLWSSRVLIYPAVSDYCATCAEIHGGSTWALGVCVQGTETLCSHLC